MNVGLKGRKNCQSLFTIERKQTNVAINWEKEKKTPKTLTTDHFKPKRNHTWELQEICDSNVIYSSGQPSFCRNCRSVFYRLYLDSWSHPSVVVSIGNTRHASSVSWYVSVPAASPLPLHTRSSWELLRRHLKGSSICFSQWRRWGVGNWRGDWCVCKNGF